MINTYICQKNDVMLMLNYKLKTDNNCYNPTLKMFVNVRSTMLGVRLRKTDFVCFIYLKKKGKMGELAEQH